MTYVNPLNDVRPDRPDRRRSCLTVPASAPAKLAKAAGIGADELVLDLEDAVAAAAKDEAPGAVLAALAEPAMAGRTVAVRVNAPRTRWCHLDLIALAGAAARPRSIVLPKVESAGDLEFVERLLDGAEAEVGAGARPLRVQALIETAAGLARVAEIAAQRGRLESLILGYADLTASLGRPRQEGFDPAAWRGAQDALLLAARANGLQAIDGPYFGTADDAGFRAAVAHARELGFDGKWAIHPAHVAALDEAFTPAPAELEHARAVIAALDLAAREGGAAVALDGEMVDEAMRANAVRVLARGGESGA